MLAAIVRVPCSEACPRPCACGMAPAIRARPWRRKFSVIRRSCWASAMSPGTSKPSAREASSSAAWRSWLTWTWRSWASRAPLDMSRKNGAITSWSELLMIVDASRL